MPKAEAFVIATARHLHVLLYFVVFREYFAKNVNQRVTSEYKEVHKTELRRVDLAYATEAVVLTPF